MENKKYFHELTEKEFERISEKRERQLVKCNDSNCNYCYGERQHICCATLVIYPDYNLTKKQAQKMMNKYETLYGGEWDYDVDEFFENCENFMNIHDINLKKEEKNIYKIIRNFNATWRITDENFSGCESCYYSL